MDYNDMGQHGGGQTSQYNDATLSIMRLHEHWVECEHYSKNGNLTKWKWKLDAIWRELSPDVIRLVKSGRPGTEDLIQDNEKFKWKISRCKKEHQYKYLDQRHQFLRSIQDLAGKGGKYVDQNPEAFE